MNTLINFLFLPVVLIVGFLAALSDIKTGKVRNSLIKKGFLYGLVVYFLLFIWSLIGRYSQSSIAYLNFGYFEDLAINAVIALAAGIVLWKMDFWAAGDAKLFALLSFILPLTAYSRDRIIYFPSFVLLLNIYTICLFYLIFAGVFKLKLKAEDGKKIGGKISEFWKNIIKRFRLGTVLDFINLVLIYAIIFFVVFGFKLKVNFLQFSLSSQLLVYLALFLIYQPLIKFLKKRQKLNILAFPLLVALTFLIPGFWQGIFSRANPFIGFFGRFFIFFIVLRLASNILSRQTDSKKIKTEELAANMLLGEQTLNLLKQDDDFSQNELGELYFDGLSPEQAEKIKNFLKNKKIEEVEIYKTFPFAPFIFVGAIITCILQGSLINWLAHFLG